MTPATVTPAMQAKAERLAGMLATCPRGRSKVNGTGFYIIPGTRPRVAHYANHLGCDCEGYRRRGVCTHQQACLIALRRGEAPRIMAGQRNYATYGQCSTRGCVAAAVGTSGRCGGCWRELRDRLGI